jgi:hypothetical protein
LKCWETYSTCDKFSLNLLRNPKWKWNCIFVLFLM